MAHCLAIASAAWQAAATSMKASSDLRFGNCRFILPFVTLNIPAVVRHPRINYKIALEVLFATNADIIYGYQLDGTI